MDKGAHFYKCDFQVHSPRDRGWAGSDCVTEDDRKEYAASLIRACRQKGLDAIAITDHHDLLFAKYVREAAAAERTADGKAIPPEKRVVVFPGMELTLNVPCQALVIFDADFPADMFSLVLTALAITPSDPSEAKTVETRRLNQITTLETLRSELDKHEYTPFTS
jgi:chromosome segregation protein